ncbi:MAG: type II secretion system protein GspG [Gammaproteobacteria bacterium TMED95]|jgi:general secretion pathway protein G|nr:MAG: type II secretion system protein GspG [Gammaproteobacteria bacterium TMED95]|tara:strand:- start:1745 stop:2185 length:441 start_codon:yes stop_codon:yes gene_type:complete
MMQKSQIKPKVSRGFTLIEIMVVVVILGILGALIVPNIVGRPDEARVTAAKSDLQQIGNALDLYRMDNGHYPSTDQGLEALIEKPSGYPEPRRWNADGYLKKLPIDPWGEPYLYFSESRQVEVYSLGSDRREGGEGVDADLNLSDL